MVKCFVCEREWEDERNYCGKCGSALRKDLLLREVFIYLAKNAERARELQEHYKDIVNRIGDDPKHPMPEQWYNFSWEKALDNS